MCHNTCSFDAQSLRLSCSLDKFFCLFLEDGAPYSYDRYQREQIRDRDVVVTAWVDDTVDESLYHSTVSVCSRILTFIHPVKKAMGMGPSEALTTRRQRLRRFPQYGMTVENKTVVEGVPAANTFSVHDFWKIEADGTDCVVLSVNFASRFTKRTLFKSLIEKSILKETNEWFAGYMTMVREALESGVKAISEPRTVLPNQPDINAALFSLLQRWLRTFYPMLVVGLLLLLLILTVLVLQLKDLQGAISMLRDKMLILQQENMQLLLELQHGWTGSASTCNVQADDADAALSNFARAR